ncbi:hypothetical protein GCM10029963_24320 [Micromonospora andamanensis]
MEVGGGRLPGMGGDVEDHEFVGKLVGLDLIAEDDGLTEQPYRASQPVDGGGPGGRIFGPDQQEGRNPPSAQAQNMVKKCSGSEP